jgi:hypothetical protein
MRGGKVVAARHLRDSTDSSDVNGGRPQSREKAEALGKAASSGLDDDGNGRVCAVEMKEHLHKLSIRYDILKDRLSMEMDMINMMIKLPNFCVCMMAFLLALVQFSPAASTADVQSHVRSHFELDALGDVTDFARLYDYMLTFEKHNQELQATSVKYWCEDRYSSYSWDKDLLMPKWTCKSPRQYALALATDANWSWTNINGGRRRSPTSHSGGHRRLAGSGSCEDNDAALQEEENDPTLTCATFTHACDIDIGIHHCPLTCGYCRPFKYNNVKRFDKPQVTMLPTMIYQTRYGKADCHGFAVTLNKQPHNPLLWQFPALDGVKHGDILHCMDRTTHWEGEYAKEVACPPSAPASLCPDGKMKITKVHKFHGLPIYAKMLLEPKNDVAKFKYLEWLDVQTETVSLSTMIYTENAEIFTSLTVDFSMSLSGNIDASYTIISYRDMVKGSKTMFVVCLVVTCTGALAGLLLTVKGIVLHPEECKWGLAVYEMLSRAVLCCFSLVLLASWSAQVPMSKEYDQLLHTFLDMESSESEYFEDAIQDYFDVKSHMYAETSWMKRMRIAAYMVLYVQFLQLIFYMSAHPKLGVLTSTMGKALPHIVHFLMIFSTLFFMLAFMAHWMLGYNIPEFGTYGDTIRAQGRMLFGEFIYIDGAEELTTGYSAMYWIYAATFMLVVFFTLLNFFLAIIVDAFVDVKDDINGQIVMSDFFTDVFRICWSSLAWRQHKWPRRIDFVKKFEAEELRKSKAAKQPLAWLDEEEEGDNIASVSCQELIDGVEGLDEDKLASFLAHYFALEKSILMLRPPTEPKEG